MTSYREAGVDLDGAARHVSAISGLVKATWGPGVVGDFGGFAAGVQMPTGFNNPVLMMSTDGVGTKLELARRSGIWEGVGHDLVAMCVDDLAAAGATPIGFVDYMAVGSLVPNRDQMIVKSVADACIVAGCPLLGGETAEHPGVMDHDAVDLAGAAMGVVEMDRELGPQRVGAGDVVIGLLSPNLRSNGFSLVRAVLEDRIDEHVASLLEPSVIYSPAVIAAVSTGAVHTAAHITGGGIVENLTRALPHDLGASIDTTCWDPPAVFDMIAAAGLDRDEMFRTFNMGLGFCLVVEADGAESVLESTSVHDSRIVGEIRSGTGVRLT